MNTSFVATYMVDEHGFIQFWESRTLSFFNSLNVILGLPINLYIVWLITTGAGSGVVSEFFALNLSVCEVIICFGSVCYVIYSLIFEACMNCPLYYSVSFFSGLLIFARPIFQCCVCVERYVAVVHPITFLKYKPIRYRLACSAVSWFILIGFSTGNMLYFTEKWMHYVMLPHFLFLFSIKSLCSIAILSALRQPGPGGSARDAEANCVKKKAFRVILIILVAMVINFGPIVFFIFLYSSLSRLQQQHGIVLITSLVIITGFVHPVIYLHRSGKLPFIKH